MSTRCVITVREADESYSIYKHSDGYPEGVLPGLQDALAFAWNLPRYEAMDMGAAIVRALKDGGGGVYLTISRDAHGDLEYHYDISQHDAHREALVITVETPVRDKDYEVTGWTHHATHYLTAAGYAGKLGAKALSVRAKRRAKITTTPGV